MHHITQYCEYYDSTQNHLGIQIFNQIIQFSYAIYKGFNIGESDRSQTVKILKQNRFKHSHHFRRKSLSLTSFIGFSDFADCCFFSCKSR